MSEIGVLLANYLEHLGRECQISRGLIEEKESTQQLGGSFDMDIIKIEKTRMKTNL